jgi:cell wall assembly regulator SMI1
VLDPTRIFDIAAALGYPAFAFPGPATEQQLARLESTTGCRLPDQLRALYLLHNGEGGLGQVDPPALFIGLPFLSVDEVLMSVQACESGLAAAEEFNLDEYESKPPSVVLPVYYSPGWVPFAGYRTATYLAIDHTPAAGGTVGQVVLFGADYEERICLAPSFDVFLTRLLAHYDRRQLHPAFGWDRDDLYEVVLEA